MPQMLQHPHPHLSIKTTLKEEFPSFESSFSPLANFKLPYHGQQRSAASLHSATFDPARRFSLPLDGYHHQQQSLVALEPIHSRTPSLSSTFASEEDSFGSPDSATSSPLPDAPFISHTAKAVGYPLFSFAALHSVLTPRPLQAPPDYGYPLYALNHQSLEAPAAYRAPQVSYPPFQPHYLAAHQVPPPAPVVQQPLPTKQHVLDIEQQRQTAAMMMMAIPQPQQPAPAPVFASGTDFPALPSFETAGGTYFFVPHGSTVTQTGSEYRFDLDDATKLKSTLKRSPSDSGNAAEAKKLKAAKAQVKRFVSRASKFAPSQTETFVLDLSSRRMRSRLCSKLQHGLALQVPPRNSRLYVLSRETRVMSLILRSSVNCDFCSKKFSRRHDKQRHESSVHAEELQDNDD